MRQTDFSNDEAVGFLADRLNRLGVEARLVALGAVEGDAVLIGREDDSVVFDFRPGIDAGVEMLGRRGEDQRFTESRPARQRRRAIDEAMPERGEGEARADVARRVDGPMSYEIGSADDPDRTESDRPGMTGHPRREQVASARRVVVKVGSSSLTTAAGGIDPARVRRARRRTRGARGRAAPRSSWSRRVRSRPDWPRSG